MDDEIANLSQRVARLQLALSNSKDELIASQLNKIKAQVRELNKEHPEIEKLFSLADRYPVAPQDIEETEISESIKEEEINLHNDDIIDSYRSMIELVNIEPNSIINTINTHITKTRVTEISQMNALHSQQIKELYRYYIMLVIKSMLVSEKYVQHSVDVNEFWLRMDQRLTKMTQVIDKKEKEAQELNRY